MLKSTLKLLFISLFIQQTAVAQWQNLGFTYGGSARQYRLYVSPNYNASNPASLVMTLHGLGDNMTNFSLVGFNYIADTANIIVVVPQAMTDALLSSTAWNSGAGAFGYYPNSSINDVGFLTALVDTVYNNYAINPNKIFVCGFSMGGFMTNRLAVEGNNLFSAYASVSGTFGTGLSSYNPNKSISICHFHGTADSTVAYNGGSYGIGADSLVHFWVNNDNCNPTPTHISVPDTYPDGYTVDHYIYSGGDNNSGVEFYKVTGADHVWLGPSNDVNYTVEIWKFFCKHSGMTTLGIHENTTKKTDFNAYPNPSNGSVTIEFPAAKGQSSIEVVDISGKTVYSQTVSAGISTMQIDHSKMEKGIYILKWVSTEGTQSKRLVFN